MTIEATHYAEARKRLSDDPIVRQLASEVPDDLDLTSWEFIQAARREYSKRGGTDLAHIGAVAEAIALVKKEGR